MAYPTREDLVEQASGEARAALDALDTAQQDALYAAAVAAVEEFTGQTFLPDDDAVRIFDGTGQKSIALPKRLAEVEIVRVSGALMDVSDVVISEKRDKLTLKTPAPSGWMLQAQAEMRGLGKDGRFFEIGNANVEITGNWGWPDEEFPAAVGDAIRTDMEDAALANANHLRGTLRAMARMGVTSIRQGNLTVERTGAAVTPLSDEAQRLILPFVWTTPGAFT